MLFNIINGIFKYDNIYGMVEFIHIEQFKQRQGRTVYVRF